MDLALLFRDLATLRTDIRYLARLMNSPGVGRGPISGTCEQLGLAAAASLSLNFAAGVPSASGL
jgi:hypothetical protein